MSGTDALPPSVASSTLATRLFGWVRLLRLSNAPTALADVWAGYAVVSGDLSPTPALVLASLASLGFYHGGMALNDACDADRDATQGRGRPIAQALISRRAASELAALLLVGGLFAACQTELFGHAWTEPFAFLLFAAVVLYNQPAVKASAAGPVVMGGCRACNLLLGAGAAYPTAEAGDEAIPYGIAAGLLVYVLGVTTFARDEAVASGQRRNLWIGIAFSAAGLLWLAVESLGGDSAPGERGWQPVLFWLVTAAFALRGMAAALLQPTPARVGRGIGIAIQGIIVIDATLATLYAGPVAGLAILALLPVTMLLSLWIPQT